MPLLQLNMCSRDFTLRSMMPQFWNYSVEFLLSQCPQANLYESCEKSISLLFKYPFSFNPSSNIHSVKCVPLWVMCCSSHCRGKFTGHRISPQVTHSQPPPPIPVKYWRNPGFVVLSLVCERNS